MGNHTNISNRRYSGRSLMLRNDKLKLSPYIPNEGLVEAVNLALLLKRPLLLMGEPGCGKTRLAKAVAYDLYKEEYKNHYEEWRIKSTTKAKDGLYRFDALKRLYDVQSGVDKTQINNTKLGEVGSYFQRGKLSQAFHKSTKGSPCILLIDEIDKADIDFPNDLLGELESYTSIVEETGEPIPEPDEKPLIIITSNKEKELPPAFLRRCIYYYIDFPNNQRLVDIINANYNLDNKQENYEKLVNKGVYIFNYIKAKSRHATKQVSTSELLDWVKALIEYSKNPNYQTIINNWLKDWKLKSLDSPDNLADIDTEIGQIPFPQVLIKDEPSWRSLKKLMEFQSNKAE